MALSALKQRLGVSFTDNTLPRYADDQIITTGSLLLVDPMHEADPWAAGVPLNGTRLPNIAAAQAKQLVGSSMEVRPQFMIGGAGLDAAYTKIERTGKGGLHGIISQTTVAVDRGFRLAFPAAILDYMQNNPTHDWYASIWYKTTRTTGATADSSTPFISGKGAASSASSGYDYAFRSRITRPNASSDTLGVRPGFTGTDVLGNMLRTTGSNGYSGTLPATDAQAGSVAQWGHTAGGLLHGQSNSVLNNFPSFVLYRMYLEDLQVSGRTYAQVDALDLSLYTKAMETAGGRYYSDTFTAPNI